jgi:hypothetical protein
MVILKFISSLLIIMSNTSRLSGKYKTLGASPFYKVIFLFLWVEVECFK